MNPPKSVADIPKPLNPYMNHIDILESQLNPCKDV